VTYTMSIFWLLIHWFLYSSLLPLPILRLPYYLAFIPTWCIATKPLVMFFLSKYFLTSWTSSNVDRFYSLNIHRRFKNTINVVKHTPESLLWLDGHQNNEQHASDYSTNTNRLGRGLAAVPDVLYYPYSNYTSLRIFSLSGCYS